tara:strand:- start:1688 stop:3292 length:1605 start_codon:yes stop_codon:yes gene_type:complete
MKKKVFVIIIILFSIHTSINSQIKHILDTKQIIIKFKQEFKANSIYYVNNKKFNDKHLNQLNKNNNVKSIKLTGNIKDKRTYAIELKSNKSYEEIIKMYKNTGQFEYVEENFKGEGHGNEFYPDDAYFNQQWSHNNDGSFANSTIDADIDSPAAWALTQGDPNLIVAILDSGVKLDHPEFSGRIWLNENEIQNGTDTDSNNYIDDINGGWDFANNDNDPTDDHGHGTNVSGIAMASGNNNIGYAGVNWNSKMMVCKILDDQNSGYYSWWAEAIYYAVDNGASVINMSVGGNSSSTLLSEAIDYAYNNNISVVVSTGNQNSSIQYPAKYSNSFAIGSTDPDDTRSAPFFWDSNSGSNYGPELDFVAPGNFIYGLNHLSNTNYNYYWGGTSQAAPHVAGLISLLISEVPSLTPENIREILINSSEDLIGDESDTSGFDEFYGNGRINAYEALLEALALNISEIEEYKFEIYPNPTSGIINLNNNGEVLNIKIYDINGKIVFENKNYSLQQLNISKLNKGIYFMKINNLDAQKIIKK